MPLQAAWYQSHLHLWANENSGAPLLPASASNLPSPHPGALSVDRLRALLGEMSAESLLASAAAESTLTLALPASADQSSCTLHPFIVPTLRLSPTEAVDLLIAPTQPPEEFRSDSYRYFARLAEFVTERLARQQFFPDLSSSESGPVANWRLLMLGEDELDRLEQFGLAMPPVARSIYGIDSQDVDPAHIVESFLASAADAIIRRDVSTDEFFSRAHQKAAEPDATPDLRWLSALLGADPLVRGDIVENDTLMDQVRSWIGKLDESTTSAPVRLCFLLEEPDDEPEDGVVGETTPSPSEPSAPPPDQPLWHLSLQLQSLDAEGQITDAAELWRQRQDLPGVLGRNIANRRAHLLAELKRAAELFPTLERIITLPEPAEITLTTIEAHLFIRQYATVLRENAFGVTLPDWTTRRDRELGLVLALSPDEPLRDEDEEALDLAGPPDPRGRGAFPDISTGKFGLDSLLDFDWQIAVGDLRLSMEDFRYLLQQNSPLARYKGQWLTIDLEAAKKAVEFLSKKPKGKMTLAEAFRTAYAQQSSEAGLPVLALTGTSWVQDLLDHAPNAKLQSVPAPSNFAGTLRPYQQRGLEWLAFLHRLGIGACLADDMGLGKTVQLIALLLHEREAEQQRQENQRLSPTLLFAPTSVVGNWTRELERFAPSLKVLVHHGPERSSGDAFVTAARQHDIVITSYALAHRDLDDIKRVSWRRLALDEAQKIKNPAAASSVAIRSLVAPHRVALTGTPIENHLSELWSIMELLNPGLLGTAADFRERFSVPIEKLQDSARAQQLRKMIQPFILRRTKADPTIAGDLPEKMEMKVYCNLTPEQASVYQKITSEMLTQIDAATGIRRRGLILAALTRLKQVCDHPALLSKEERATQPLTGRSGKCERLAEMLEEVIEEGDAALIFTQYREMGHLLERFLGDRLKTSMLFLHGGTPAKKRDEMITQFQDPASGIKLFILSLRAGGLGLNLTAANHVFHFDRWWNPAVEAQATDRAYRIGQTRKVQVHKFICVGTMEERIDKLLSDKIALADQIVRAGDDWLTNLSTNELKEYLSLSSDAVGEY